MDPIGWFLATTHNLLGHDVLARMIEQPPGDKQACVLCQYERWPTEENRHRVISAIGLPASTVSPTTSPTKTP